MCQIKSSISKTVYFVFNYPVSGPGQGLKAPAPVIGVVFQNPSPGTKVWGGRGEGEGGQEDEKEKTRIVYKTIKVPPRFELGSQIYEF